MKIEYVPISQVVLWDENPKRHDIGAIIQSIERYGFKDPPKFEPKLNGGEGGIVEGNGRTICLQQMKDSDMEVPRGILLSDGDWAVPVVFGVDAESEDAAKAYAVDHNNLTLSGGDLDGFDMSRMWGPEYTDLLSGLGELPVSVDGDTFDVLSQYAAIDLAGIEFPEYDESVEGDVEWAECPECGHKWPK